MQSIRVDSSGIWICVSLNMCIMLVSRKMVEALFLEWKVILVLIRGDPKPLMQNKENVGVNISRGRTNNGHDNGAKSFKSGKWPRHGLEDVTFMCNLQLETSQVFEDDQSTTIIPIEPDGANNTGFG